MLRRSLQLATRFFSTKPKVYLPESISITDLSQQLGVFPGVIINVLKDLQGNQDFGFESILSQELAEVLAYEFNTSPELVTSSLPPLRPPIVTIMGHVDHGKTTLLDSFRNSNLTQGEYGGITQSIGAFSMKTSSGQKITFIDTPGHEAFTEMRARGAQVTDIVILVVCAVEGVQPQTLEAIDHALDAEVEMIVAINKIDLPGANQHMVELQLVEAGVVLEKQGGEIFSQPISAKNKIGLSELEELILFKSELMELRADPDRRAQGVVIESQRGQGRGHICSVLVQQGTLKIGDIIVSGASHGKVRQMFDDSGKQVKTAGPSDAVEIIGLKELPEAGDDLMCLNSPNLAESVSSRRQMMIQQMRQGDLQAKDLRVNIPRLNWRERKKLRTQDTTLLVTRMKEIKEKEGGVFSEGDIEKVESLFSNADEAQIVVILKAQNKGMLETLENSVRQIAEKRNCTITIAGSSVGDVTATDVEVAKDSGAVIFAMESKATGNIRKNLERYKIPFKSHKIIYHLLDELNALINDFNAPEHLLQVMGSCEVKKIYEIDGPKKKKVKIAGSEVTSGVINRRLKCRVVRNGKIVQEDVEIESLRHFKDQVREVSKGMECGISVGAELKVGDIIEVYDARERVKEFTGGVNIVGGPED